MRVLVLVIVVFKVSAWPDTSDGIHLFTLRGVGPERPESWGNNSAMFVWAVSEPTKSDQLRKWRDHQPDAILSHYIPYTRDPVVGNHTLEWWQKAHPSFILYTCDRKTPAYYGTDPNVPLDISNPAVIEWQLNGLDNEKSARKIANLGYDSISADNFNLYNGNPYSKAACGVWRNGKWVQLYSGQYKDDKFAKAQVDWARQFRSGLAPLRPERPLLLVPNFGLDDFQNQPDLRYLAREKEMLMEPKHKPYSWNDSIILSLGNVTDGILSECGFTGCEWRLSTGAEWENKIRFMINLQESGKAYLDNSYWGCNSTGPNLQSEKLLMNSSNIQYIIASYLMGKGRHSSLYVHPNRCTVPEVNETCSCGPGYDKNEDFAGTFLRYPQFWADVGGPVHPMTAIDSSQTLWRREYTKSLVLVNSQHPSSSTANKTVPLPTDCKYIDMFGVEYSMNAVMPPRSALVLFKEVHSKLEFV